MAANMHFVELSRNMMALIKANEEEWKPEKDGLRLCSNPVKLEELAKKIKARMVAANVEGDLDQLTDSCILNYTHQLCKKKHGDNDARAFRSFVKAGMPTGAPVPQGDEKRDGEGPGDKQESSEEGQEQPQEGEQPSEDAEDSDEGEQPQEGESDQSEGDESEEQESKPEEQAGDGEGNQADTDAEDQSSDEDPAPEQEQEPEEQPQEEPQEEAEKEQEEQPEPEPEPEPQEEPEEQPQEETNTPEPSKEKERPFLKPRNWEYCVSLYKMGKRFILKGDKGNGKTETILHIHSLENRIRMEQGRPEKGLYIVAAPDDESAFIGYFDAMGKFVRPAFIDAVVNGYDIAFDEVEKGEPRAYAKIFSLLANGILTLANGEEIHVHPETRFMATANTSGRGSEKGYISNKMDPAFLDRFLAVESFYEHEIDMKCAKGDKSLVTFVEQWREGCRATGAYDQLISYRGVSDIKEISTCGMPGCDLEQAMRSCVTRASALGKDELAAIMESITCDNKYSQMLNKIYESMPNE